MSKRKPKPLTKYEILQKFQASAGCMYTQEKAKYWWEQLRPFLDHIGAAT